MAATLPMLVGLAAGPILALWSVIALHEIAHALVARCLGGRVLEVRIGSGRHVLPARWFGVRWELRLWPKHGLVVFHIPSHGGFRARMLAILLAGPLTSTIIAVIVIGLWFVVPPAAELQPALAPWGAAAWGSC